LANVLLLHDIEPMKQSSRCDLAPRRQVYCRNIIARSSEHGSQSSPLKTFSVD
jgi:hypothetical protein